MSRRNLVICFVALAILILGSTVQPGHADGVTISIFNIVVLGHSCTYGWIYASYGITISVPNGATAVMRFSVTAPGAPFPIDASSSLGTIVGPATVTNPDWGLNRTIGHLASHTPITVRYYDANSSANAGFSVDCQTGVFGGAAGQWFNPGDGRIDPRPGDRLAIYCNTTATPPNVTVFGIADDVPDSEKGFELATFNNADLLKAGVKGITKKVRVTDIRRLVGANLGTVSMMQDGNGHFYVAWNGGRFHATGLGDFCKSFTCDFPK